MRDDCFNWMNLINSTLIPIKVLGSTKRRQKSKLHYMHIWVRVFFFFLDNKFFSTILDSCCSLKNFALVVGTFTIAKNFPHGFVELFHYENGNFKINGQQVKPYLGGDFSKKKSCILLANPEWSRLKVELETLKQALVGRQPNFLILYLFILKFICELFFQFHIFE